MLTRVETGYAGRAYAAYGGVYIRRVARMAVGYRGAAADRG